jgi:hypothetical protein
LEAGYWSHALCVDFKGLGTYLENCFVELKDRPIQVSSSNHGRRDVRRVQVSPSDEYVTAEVVQGQRGRWHFAPDAAMGNTEDGAECPGSFQQRRVLLTETDIIPKGSAAAAPAARRQPLYFLNESAL